jgi:hypothetical protein
MFLLLLLNAISWQLYLQYRSLSSQTCASFVVCRLKHVLHLLFVVSNMCVICCLSSQTCASFGVCRLKHVCHLVFVVSNMCIIWHLKHVHHNSFGVCCLKNVHHLSFVVSNMCIICLLNYHPWLSYGHKLGGGGIYI